MPNSIVELFNRCHQLDRVEQQKVIEKLRLDDPKMADELDALLKAEPTQFGIPAKPDDHQSSSFQIPQVIDEYRVEGILGVGGMGMVLQGHRADIDLSVAIKVAHQSNTSTTTKIALEQEAKILASLEHPNIASIKDWGTIDNFGHFIATEFIRGKTIQQYCEDENLSIKAIIQLFLKVISAVSHAHSRLVLHRDIKPSNIMVTDQGEPKLIDFGVAKVMTSIHESEEQTLSAGLTPSYASPEQLAGKPLSIRSDVYSLGLVLITLLCDEVVPQHTAHQIKDALLKQKKEKPQFYRTISKQNCQELALVLAKACHEDAEQRYENTQALSRDLSAILNQKPIEARAPGVIYRIRKFIIRNKWATAISGAALALAFMGLAIAVGYWKKEQQTFQDLKKSQEELLTYTDFLEEILKGMDVAAGGSASVTMGDFLERTAELYAQETKVQNYQMAVLGGSIANIYQGWGQYEKSYAILNTALNKANKSESLKDDIYILTTQAAQKIKLGEYDAAKKLLKQSMELAQNDKQEHADRIAYINVQLMMIYSYAEQYQEAIKQAQILISHSDTTQNYLGHAYMTLATSYGELFAFKSAVDNSQFAMKIFAQVYGEHSIQYLQAKTIEYRNKVKAGLTGIDTALQRSLLEEYDKVLGENRPDKGVLYFFFSELAYLENRLDLSIKYIEEAQRIFNLYSMAKEDMVSMDFMMAYYLWLSGELSTSLDILNSIKNLALISENPAVAYSFSLTYFKLVYFDSTIKELENILVQSRAGESDAAQIPSELLYMNGLINAKKQDWLTCMELAVQASNQATQLYPKNWKISHVYRYLADVCQLKHDNRQVNNNDFPYLPAVMDSPWRQEAILVTQILNTE